MFSNTDYLQHCQKGETNMSVKHLKVIDIVCDLIKESIHLEKNKNKNIEQMVRDYVKRIEDLEREKE